MGYGLSDIKEKVFTALWFTASCLCVGMSMLLSITPDCRKNSNRNKTAVLKKTRRPPPLSLTQVPIFEDSETLDLSSENIVCVI